MRTFRGTDGAMVGNFIAFSGAGSPIGVRMAIEDRDGDGLADIVVGAGSGQARVRTFKGTTLAQIGEFLAYDPGFLGGVFVG